MSNIKNNISHISDSNVFQYKTINFITNILYNTLYNYAII